MKTYPVAVIINFCTNESLFLKDCIEQSLLFARQVIVPVCDHFFDGKPENRSLLDQIYQSFPGCRFIEYPFVPKQIPKQIFKTVDPSHFWHSLSRLIGCRYLHDEIDTVLFLDADEIPDGNRFAEWLACSDYTLHTILKMANYWYFREARFQAEKWEDSIVLAQKKALTPHLLLHQDEREAMYDSLPHPKRRNVVGVDGRPMFHHYSWVRSEEDMLRKVRAWGHRQDRDWEALVKKEFQRPFQGVDFVHGYRFQTVSPAFDLQCSPAPFLPRTKGDVIKLTSQEVVSAAKSGRMSRWKLIFG
jgi:hypothetical protein